MERLTDQFLSQRIYYPEKILQFGTGVLLRGLIDYFVHQANTQGIFQGSIVVVKSTPGSVDDFQQQNNLFTHLLKGIQDGELKEETILNTSINRVLTAAEDWAAILATAQSPDLEIIISNTTEVGIQYVEEAVLEGIPESFPAKLIAWLYKRYQHFAGDYAKGVVIIPTELLVDNGDKLKEIVLRLADFHALDPAFMQWIQEANYFCNSLVDRIVPGTPKPEKLTALWEELGYKDELLISSELYALWAIQVNDFAQSKLSFASAHPGVILDQNIADYRERKLRILNGTHTLTVCLAYLSGLHTVYEAMQDPTIAQFVADLALSEICPVVPVSDPSTTEPFAREVLDRFRNPSIRHYLLDITLQSTTKMRMRNVPNILRYFEKFGQVPERMAQGMAAYLLFEKSVKVENNHYFGQRGTEFYVIRDDFASYFYEKWQSLQVFSPENIQSWVGDILANVQLWGENLSQLPGFGERIGYYLHQFIHQGIPKNL